MPKNLVEDKETHPSIARQAPKKVFKVFLDQPPIFSGKPFLKRTRLPSAQPPLSIRSVISLLMPG